MRLMADLVEQFSKGEAQTPDPAVVIQMESGCGYLNSNSRGKAQPLEDPERSDDKARREEGLLISRMRTGYEEGGIRLNLRPQYLSHIELKRIVE